MALGWPVKEKGPQPGLPIWPLSKCRLIKPPTVAVPSTRWFSPIDQRLSTALEPAQRLAMARRSSSGIPQIAAVRAGVQAATWALKSSKPSVAVATNEPSMLPACKSRWAMPCNRARSVPEAMARWQSAIAAVAVARGSITMMFKARPWRFLRLSRRWNNTG